MIYKIYGRTGVKLGAVGFGGMRFDLSRSNEENAELLLHARDKGVNYFDTAPDYCQDRSEPIFGKGLWGTLYGYLALRSDLETIQGITFYQHKETPGLGGEVDNPSWKAQWEGVKLFDEEGAPAALVFKGPAPSDNPFAVDGLSGATITSRGVTNLIRYWASEDGYGPYLRKLADELGVEPAGA